MNVFPTNLVGPELRDVELPSRVGDVSALEGDLQGEVAVGGERHVHGARVLVLLRREQSFSK